jgi:hypothetical protein
MRMLAWAATLWLVGTLVWTGYYLAGSGEVPNPPGPWDVPLVLARALVIVAIVTGMRSLISFRVALLDVSVVCAATLALSSIFLAQGFENASPGAWATLNRPLLSIVTLMLLASAALGSWQGLPLSMVLMGLGEVGLTVGSLIYSFQALEGAFDDNRWADLGWAAGAALSILAASSIILGVDRPVRTRRRAAIPQEPAGSRALLLVSLAALVLTLAVACYGLFADATGVALAGVLAAVWIGAAMALRARRSLAGVEAAYERLDHALAEVERHSDALATSNEELGRANIQMRAMHLALSDVLNLADERSDGRLRELIETTGGELAGMLEDELRQTPPRGEDSI